MSTDSQPNLATFVDAADDTEKAIHRYSDGSWWLLRRHPSTDGWVTVRQLTMDDMGALVKSLTQGTGVRICLDLSIGP